MTDQLQKTIDDAWENRSEFSPKSAPKEISDAVESIWGVTVLKVNTLNRKGKVTRARRTGKAGSKPDTKRAIVTLAAGDEIPLFEH